MSSIHSKIFALIDCNNFYVSCERIFNPKLNNKPVIVLSNNDGCVISRSNEAKLLGIKMGEPYFQIENLCKKNNVNVFSSNFSLYGDISNRVMKTISALCPEMEIYSIDEAFIRLDKIAVDPINYAKKIKETVFQHIGIPVSIGIAPTKTLAKVATNIAKKNANIEVCDLRSEKLREIILKSFPIGDLWGIGRKLHDKLIQLKIETASQLTQLPESFLKRKFNLMMSRLVMELNGVSCLPLEDIKNKKSITCSRSFGKPTGKLSDLQEAVSCYVSQACEKARAQKTKARAIYVYLQTNPFEKTKPFYSAGEQQSLLLPSNDTILITKISHELIKKIFRPYFLYQKIGIILLDLIPENLMQQDLFCKNQGSDNKELMSTLDSINKKWGAKSLFLASDGIENRWKVKQLKRSPKYTTAWDELLKVEVPGKPWCLR